VDADSGLTHTLVTTPANAADVTKAHGLLRGDEKIAFGDAGHRGVEKREAQKAVGTDDCARTGAARCESAHSGPMGSRNETK